ncbi:hypothetical protein Tco_1217563 [Tanacetum coccineum]
MQTQEDHSNPIPALNVDSLKVDLVVIQNTCSKKEDSNSETASSKSVKESSLNSETKDVHAIKYKMSKAKERCMAYFSLHSNLQVFLKKTKKALASNMIQTGIHVTLWPQTSKPRFDPTVDVIKQFCQDPDSKHFVCSTCHKCVFSANHDACITKLLKEVNSRAKIQSHKTRNSNKPVDQKSHTQEPGRQIFTGHRFSPNKTFTVDSSGKVIRLCQQGDSEPLHGLNVDIPNIHECKQTLNVGAELESSIRSLFDRMTSMIELESLFGPSFDEYFNGENQVVLKYSAVTTADASYKRQQQPDSTSSTLNLATTVVAGENFDL